MSQARRADCFIRVASIIAICLSSTIAQAASFNCAKATTDIERAVCIDPKLSAADDALARAYKSLRASLSQDASADVLDDQRSWLQWLKVECIDAKPEKLNACLQNGYQRRIDLLQDGNRTISNMHFYPRSITISVKMTEPIQGWPPYGFGDYEWPQIDRPTPAQAAWNEAIKKQAALLSQSVAEQSSAKAAFSPESVDGQDDDLWYSQVAANESFIITRFTYSYYGYGAAHPLTSITTMNWSAAKQAVLTVNDIFASNAAWQPMVAHRIYAKLIALPDYKDMKWNTEADLTGHTIDAISHVDIWTLTAQGAEITFPQYSIGPYSYGMPTVTFTWDELKSCLSPTFHPQELPSPIVK
jgi:uncharacterized protein